MLNFNRRDGTPDPRSGIKAPLKPAHYDPPETPARAHSATATRPSMPSAPAAGSAAATPPHHDAVAPAARPATAAASSAAASAPTQMTATAGGSTLSVGINIHLKGVEISNCDALVIEGQVEATVHSKTMQIDKPGTLSGTAVIEVAEIHGEFSGELDGADAAGGARNGSRFRDDPLRQADRGRRRRAHRRHQADRRQRGTTRQAPLLKPDSRHHGGTSSTTSS